MAHPASSRRSFLKSSALVGAWASMGGQELLAAPRGGDVTANALDAFVWGVPLVLAGRYIEIAAKAGLPFNRFTLSPDLATPATRALGAQVDTLYGLGWLDLAAEPQVIEVPDTADRYYSIQLLDAYQNSFAYIGRRVTGTKAGAFALTPPGYTGPIPKASGRSRLRHPGFLRSSALWFAEKRTCRRHGQSTEPIARDLLPAIPPGG